MLTLLCGQLFLGILYLRCKFLDLRLQLDVFGARGRLHGRTRPILGGHATSRGDTLLEFGHRLLKCAVLLTLLLQLLLHGGQLGALLRGGFLLSLLGSLRLSLRGLLEDALQLHTLGLQLCHSSLLIGQLLPCGGQLLSDGALLGGGALLFALQLRLLLLERGDGLLQRSLLLRDGLLRRARRRLLLLRLLKRRLGGGNLLAGLFQPLGQCADLLVQLVRLGGGLRRRTSGLLRRHLLDRLLQFGSALAQLLALLGQLLGLRAQGVERLLHVGGLGSTLGLDQSALLQLQLGVFEGLHLRCDLLLEAFDQLAHCIVVPRL
mmetsp:Transcript_34596/g.86936  ORF Transcript_34596/g.86936 Transcript_34596/m.86936 type:complete len:320 (-) Transcript_34596:1155-2114(-)